MTIEIKEKRVDYPRFSSLNIKQAFKAEDVPYVKVGEQSAFNLKKCIIQHIPMSMYVQPVTFELVEK